jgi:uncharacterized protein YbjT (DUF2867 family)
VILVVGATGQVGSRVVQTLRALDEPVRAMVRDPASAADLVATGVELAVADLGRPETLDGVLEGVSAVVATANAVAPIRPGDTAAAVDNGYAELVHRAERAGVSRFVLGSVPITRLDEGVPVAYTKRRTEQLLAQSGLSWLSLRMAPFTEVWLAPYEQVLLRRVRVVSQPAAAFAAGQRLLAPLAPSLAGVMALSRLIATSETDWDTADAARRLGLGRRRTVEEVLREKAALPAIR